MGSVLDWLNMLAESATDLLVFRMKWHVLTQTSANLFNRASWQICTHSCRRVGFGIFNTSPSSFQVSISNECKCPVGSDVDFVLYLIKHFKCNLISRFSYLCNDWPTFHVSDFQRCAYKKPCSCLLVNNNIDFYNVLSVTSVDEIFTSFPYYVWYCHWNVLFRCRLFF